MALEKPSSPGEKGASKDAEHQAPPARGAVMEMKFGKKGDAVLVKLTGRMDGANAILFERKCAQLMEEGETGFILDLGGLDFISSPGLRSVLIVGKKVSEIGGKFLLCNLGGGIKEVFDVSGL
ncbi:MAG: STAS domain-containing protein, partial [Lentisphaerota bacterium]